MMIVCCSICANWTAISAIATGLSAIATMVLAIFAFISLLQSKKQIKEIKNQQEEDTRARLFFEIVSQDNHFYLKITNAGKSTAYRSSWLTKGNLKRWTRFWTPTPALNRYSSRLRPLITIGLKCLQRNVPLNGCLKCSASTSLNCWIP